MNAHSEDDRSSLAKSLGRASEASSVVFTIGICFLAGYGLDRLFDTSPVLALLGLGLGLFTAFWQLIKMANRMSKPEVKSDQGKAANKDSQ